MADEDRTARQQPSAVALFDQVKDALEHLHDVSYLELHPLAQVFAPLPGQTAGQRLRRELTVAIETLGPAAGVPTRAPEARVYELLVLHYVESHMVHDAAHRLGLSRRQAHRDLRRGIESVAAAIRARSAVRLAAEPRAVSLSSPAAELGRLATNPAAVDVAGLLHRAQRAVEPLATRRNVHVRVDAPQSAMMVSTDAMMAEQVLVDILSRAVAQSLPGTLRLALSATDVNTVISVDFERSPASTGEPLLSEFIGRMVDRLGWQAGQQDCVEGKCRVGLMLPAARPAALVLVIDDNAGLVELLARYLADQACRVVAAADGQAGLHLAQQMRPDAILLDVMMPEMHGWEVLQRLRNHSSTARIPVVICSVFDNPELAYSLGASFFLPKPVRQADVLDALHRLGVV